MDLSMTLREALEREASGVSVKTMTDAVARLSARYRVPAAAREPILAKPLDVLAYAHYRMPATYAAVRAALLQLATSGMIDPAEIRSVADLGGGTGAASWAAASVLDEVRDFSVLDQVPDALDLGQKLAKLSGNRGLERAVWQEGKVGFWNVSVGAPSAGGADLVIVSYVLSELTDEQASKIVAEALAAARKAILIIEPGTPDGYARIMRARDELLAETWQVAAPCPHQGACPLVDDWCHFAARVNRSARHRQIKGGDLSHEDEKFSYVAVVREPAHVAHGFADAPEVAGASTRPSRIIRRPKKNKGFVELELCESVDPADTAGRIERRVVTKKDKEAYRAARDASWGDVFDF